MRLRACWILLGAALIESLVGLAWQLRGGHYQALMIGVGAAINLIWFLCAEHKEPAAGYQLW